MAAPWEKYAKETESPPWEKYSSPQEDSRGLLQTVGDAINPMNWPRNLAAGLQTVDEYTGAPVRKFVTESMTGENLDHAPSGAEQAGLLGASDITYGDYFGLPEDYQKYIPGSRMSPKDVAGFGLEMIQDPLALAGEGVKVLSKGAQSVGRGLKNIAETQAFKSTGAALKDFRRANNSKQVNDIGRFVLDNKLVRAGDSVEDVAQKALNLKNEAGTKLDDLYLNAGEEFKAAAEKIGFDPKRDKQRIMAAAKRELRDTVDKDQALNKLSNYLDDVSKAHGDKPNEEVLNKFTKDKTKYVEDTKNFRRDRADYKNQIGNDEINQGLLPSFADDLQRTGEGPLRVELQGKDPSIMHAEPYEVWKQGDLLSLPQRESPGFNPARGEDLLPMRQQMAMDDNFLQGIANDGYQSEILGAHPTERTFSQGLIPKIETSNGQMKFAIPPERPIRPLNPDEVRNPMNLRRTNDIKGAMDQEINYSRNPLASQPNNEAAFLAGRRELNNIILETAEELTGKTGSDALKAANKDYSLASKIHEMALDKMNRETSNRMFGLTDTIAGGAGTTVGAISAGAPGAVIGGLLAAGANKAARKYGPAMLATGADRLSKGLLGLPKISSEQAMLINKLMRARPRPEKQDGQ